VTIRVVVADDQGMVRSGFSILLNAQPDIEVVGEAVNGQEAVARVAELCPDVILMDVRMPVLDGLQATRQITAANGAPRVLVLTTFDLDDYVYEALRGDRRPPGRRGADGQDARQPHPDEACVARPRSGRGLRLRERPRSPR